MRIFQEAKYSQLVDEENPILSNTDNLENNELKVKNRFICLLHRINLFFYLDQKVLF